MSAVDNDRAAISIALRVPLSEIFEDLLDSGDEDSPEDGTVSQVVSGNLSSQVAQLAAGLKVG
jgi:hypothetical protein